MSDGFLGRWARRKLEVKREELARQSHKVQDALVPDSSGIETAETSLTTVESKLDAEAGSSKSQVGQQQAEPLVLPTEADLNAVVQGGEIRDFMNPQVSGDLRNKAFKALFSQPQFNQMDFMDVYVDDYSVSKPLTAAMIDMMALAKQLLSRPDLEPKPEAVAEVVSGAASHSTLDAAVEEPLQAGVLNETSNEIDLPMSPPTDLQPEQAAVLKTENN